MFSAGSIAASATSNGGLWFEKSGTQRMAGFLYPQEGMWVYLGAQSAKGEPLHRYSGRAASVGGDINPDDQVGVLVGIGNNHLRSRPAVARYAENPISTRLS